MEIEFMEHGEARVRCDECGRKVNESFVLDFYGGSPLELCAECMEDVADQMKVFLRKPRT